MKTQQQFTPPHIAPSRCNRCGRVLKDPGSIKVGYGPSCLQAVNVEMKHAETITQLPFNRETWDVECRRTADGGIKINIPHVLFYHSPGGIDWGYSGSGPSDFALNILYCFTLDEDFSKRWHQPFKWEFVANLPDEGGVISGEIIRSWIAQKRRDEGAGTMEIPDLEIIGGSTK